MGNSILKGQQGKTTLPPLLDETQIFTLWTINDVRDLWKRFQNQIYGFALVEAQFETIICIKENVSKHVKLEDLFNILDNDHDGRIDGLELLGGLTLCCQSSFEEKARFCFELFDFNLNACMSRKELIIMMMSSVCGLNILTGGGEELEPDLEVFEKLADDAIERADMNSDGQISFEEFLYWARTNRELMAGLETLNKISLDAKNDIDPEDSAEETDDGDLTDVDEIQSFPTKLSKKSRKADKRSANLAVGALLKGDEAQATVPWLGQICEPTNFRPSKKGADGPDTNLELSWAHGYKAQSSRNNLRYVGSTDSDPHKVVYFTAALGVVYDLTTRQQKFYMGHEHEVTCLAMHPSQQIVATGDVKSNIHIWNADVNSASALPAQSIIKGIVKHGIQHLIFSPLGDRIVSVGLDPDHTVTVYDIATGSVISSAKGLVSPNTVLDIAYSNNGQELALVGKNQIKFFKGVHSNKRALESHTGKIGSIGKLQTYFCVTYFKEDAIVGCASGELYRFKDGQCVEVLQAHGVKEPILSMYFNKPDGTLITGGKDSLIKTWDYTFHEVGTAIDISEDVDGDGKADNGSLDCAIISVQQVGNRVLFGTKGSDIFEARLPSNPSEHHTLSRIGWGHSSGELWGLAMHPLRDEFATCGDDKTMRIWSIRTHEQVNLRVLPTEARVLAYNTSGETLCIGMQDGSVALIESGSAALRVYSTWKHCERAITDAKFSPDGMYLAVGSQDTNIYIYKSDDKKNFIRQAVCRGHSGAVTHLDFSANSQFIQSNGNDYSLLYWDVKGNQVKASSSLRDTVWATYTCTLGWAVQGIWPKGCDYTDINACMALPDIGDIVTGDDFHRVNLFRYPALKEGALHQSYVGHASHVTNVRFSSNRRYAATIGGTDRTILLWRHDLEVADSDGDNGGYSSSSSSSSNAGNQLDVRHEIADVGLRTIEQEAANMGWTNEEMKEFVTVHKNKKFSKGGVASVATSSSSSSSAGKGGANLLLSGPDKGDESSIVKPWRSAIAEPTQWTPCVGVTDVDLSLKWIHGYRSYDCRNNVLYSAAGYIVYNTAALAVVHNKAAGKQQFLLGAHVDEVVGIAVHPAGQIFATGEAGRQPSIVVWNSKDMNVLIKIEGAHERGVPLLAFNSKGNILASIGLDADCSLCIHDWSKNIQILKTATDKSKVLCLCFLANDSLSLISNSVDVSVDVVATGGEKHLKFWWSQGQNVQSQRALWGEETRHTIMTLASTNKNMCVSGSSTGILLIWHNFKVVYNAMKACKPADLDSIKPPSEEAPVKQLFTESYEYPHKSAIHAIWAIKGSISPIDLHDQKAGYRESSRYITGDKNGVVCIWRLAETEAGDLYLSLMKTFSTSQLTPKSTGFGVRSLCERDGVILIGTKGNEIYEVTEVSIPFIPSLTANNFTLSSNPSSAPHSTAATVFAGQKLNAGHNIGEVWGLAMHPSLSIFLTTGDDNTLRCWNLVTNKLMSYVELPDKCRAVDIKPSDGLEFAIVLNSGVVWVIPMESMLNPLKKKNVPIGTFDANIEGCEILIQNEDNAGKPATGSVAAVDDKPVLSKTELSEGPTQWCQVVKYSFEGSQLAVGSHDHVIYIYDVKNKYNLKYKLTDHPSYVTHIDFGLLLKNRVIISVEEVNRRKTTTFVNERFDFERHMIVKETVQTVAVIRTIEDEASSAEETTPQDKIVSTDERPVTSEDICLQSTSGDGDLLYWCGDGTRIVSATTVKDAWWATFTCPYGWSVQGMWSVDGYDGAEINAVARSHSWDKVPVVACVDNFGRLRLYNYPCVIPGSSDKCYKGHASNVTNIAFSHDDAYCVTVGGTDKGIFIWSTDIEDEIRERAAFAAVSGMNTTSSVELSEYDIEDPYAIVKLIPSTGDESGAIKPWKGAIREPSTWKDPSDLGELPDANLELKFVYGYRGWDCRNNISFADSRFEVVYHIAGVGVVFNSEEHKQIHNTEHDDDILCLSVHPEGHTVATGEIGKTPKIVLWDANTGVTIRVIKYHKRGVANVCFSPDGNLLVSTGMDDERTVAVHNVKSGAILGKGKAGKGTDVYSINVGVNGMFVTGGKNHIKFWTLPSANAPGGELSSKAGIYNLKTVKARTVVSTAFLGADAVSGMNDGMILLWKDRSNTKFCQAHTGAVTAMCIVPDTAESRELGPRIVSGGKDGQIHIWDVQFNKVWSMDLKTTQPISSCAIIQALAIQENRLLIGTKASEIYEVNILNATETYRLVEGHFDERSEVWGLATHPTMQRFVTCGDDQTVRLWDSKSMRPMDVINIGTKARAVAYHPDGTQIAVATYDGKVHILGDRLQNVITCVTVSASWIQAMVFSPDGSLLAVGSHDDIIYILETKSFSCKFKLKGHHSFITAVDFSHDGTRLQSASGDYELLFWDCVTGRQITSATEMRDIKWHKFTSTLGWPVQGIWPPNSDGTDVNAVDRSPDGKYLVSGDDFRLVKLFKYPCPKERSKSRNCKGHAEHVMNVKFSADNHSVFSVGGLDKVVLQFEVKESFSSGKK